MTNWKPGDAAIVSTRDGHESVGIKGQVHGWYTTRDYVSDDSVTDARPLVVIDPDDREQVERLIGVMSDHGWTALDDDAPDDMQAVLRSLLAPPRPAEPTGLGAVVVDDRGERWVRTDEFPYPWQHTDNDEAGDHYTESCYFTDIKVTAVLSEGVPS